MMILMNSVTIAVISVSYFSVVSFLHAKIKIAAIFKCFIVLDMFACMLLEKNKNKTDTAVHMMRSFYSYISHFWNLLLI